MLYCGIIGQDILDFFWRVLVWPIIVQIQPRDCLRVRLVYAKMRLPYSSLKKGESTTQRKTRTRFRTTDRDSELGYDLRLCAGSGNLFCCRVLIRLSPQSASSPWPLSKPINSMQPTPAMHAFRRSRWGLLGHTKALVLPHVKLQQGSQRIY